MMEDPARFVRRKTVLVAVAALVILCLGWTTGCSADRGAGPDRGGTMTSSNSSSVTASSANPTLSVGSGSRTPSPGSASNRSGGVAPPPAGAAFDYQLGGPYAPPDGVRVVSRDRTAPPAAGLYNICYVNAFQAQPDALDWWRSNHPDLLLHRDGRRVIIDANWNEALLDTSTAARRAALAAIVDAWIYGCAASGFQAVEPDNLDSFERSDGLLTAADNAAFAQLINRRAHADGLAVGQKNTTELLGQRASIGFDFAVTEECGAYDECAGFASVYDGRVYDIEYSDSGLVKACAGWRGRISIVRRDQDVSPAGEDGYRYGTC